MSYQNFKEIIKEEWEREFPNNECPYEDSLFLLYKEMVEKVCTRVHNAAIELAAEKAVTCFGDDTTEHIVVNQDSILKLIINEEGTDTTEV